MFKWLNNRENAKYIYCLRVLYGVTVGAVMCAFYVLCEYFQLGRSCFALIGAAIPVIMSGGLYLTGFTKTSALLAQRMAQKAGIRMADKDKTPEIAAMTFYMLYAGGLSVIRTDRQIVLLAVGYMISRTLYGMAFVWFPEAKKERENKEKERYERAVLSPTMKKALRIILSVILALCFCTCVVIEPIMGMLEALVCMWAWTYYYYRSKKVFGGVTEESAEYFLVVCELALALFTGIFGGAFL